MPPVDPGRSLRIADSWKSLECTEVGLMQSEAGYCPLGFLHIIFMIVSNIPPACKHKGGRLGMTSTISRLGGGYHFGPFV